MGVTISQPDASVELNEEVLEEEISRINGFHSYELNEVSTYEQLEEEVKEPTLFDDEAEEYQEAQWLKQKKREEYLGALQMAAKEDVDDVVENLEEEYGRSEIIR